MSKALHVTERTVSMLMAGGLGYMALMRLVHALVIAWAMVFADGVAKVILFEIAHKNKPAA